MKLNIVDAVHPLFGRDVKKEVPSWGGQKIIRKKMLNLYFSIDLMSGNDYI